jgi:hypothetical protein
MSLVGWTAERELLTGLLDAVQQMHATLIAANSERGRRPEVPKPHRPRTLVDDLRLRRDRDEAQQVIDMFSPRHEGAAS